MAAVRIGELLIQEGLITAAQLQAALTAQQIFGGRLGTNLVEHGFVSEVDLAHLLSRQLGIRMVEPHELSDVPASVIATVPSHLARKFVVVPYAADDAKDRVSLAVADPNNLQKIDEIQFALGKRIDIAICPEVMLAWAMEKYYGVEQTRRYIRLSGATDAAFQIGQGETPVRSAPVAGSPRVQGATGAGTSLTHDEILARIVRSPTKKDLVAAVTQLLGRIAGQVVFLAVRGQHATCWEAKGLALTTDELREVSMPIGTSRLLREAVQGCRHVLAEASDDGALLSLLEGPLGMSAAGQVFVLPLIVNQKVFGAYVMTRLDAATFGTAVPLLVEVMRRVSYRLQIFFLMEQLSAPL